jgi:hypothetical protein
MTRSDRIRTGQAARDRVPLPDHGRWWPAPDRADPVALLDEHSQLMQALPR